MKKVWVVGIVVLFFLVGIFPSSAINSVKESFIPLNNEKNIYIDDNTKETWDSLREHSNQLPSIKNNLNYNRKIYPQYNHIYHIRDIDERKIMKKITDKIPEELPNNLNPYNKNEIYIQDKIQNQLDSNVIYVPDDYPTIQSAIDNASAGDTIIVRNGVYKENIVIDKPIKLQSEEGYSRCTIIQKSGSYVIRVKSDYVTISGFDIRGIDAHEKLGIYIKNVNYTNISWNKITKSYHLIKGVQTNNNTIHDNIMGSPGSYIESWAIWLKYADNNVIYNNEIKNLDMYAVSIHLEISENNTVKNNILRGSYCVGMISAINNTILDNNWGAGFWAQMYIKDSHYNQIINNSFPTANIDGIILLSSTYNTFKNNVFTKSGIFVYESYKNTMENNIVNSKPLIYMEDESSRKIFEDAGQIILVNCFKITIKNQVISNTIVGVELFKTDSSIILNCDIHSHEYEAIYAVFSNDNLIYNCTFSNCENAIGMYSCNGNEINSSNFHSMDWETMIIGSSSYYNKIVWNNITKNYLGIKLKSSNYNDICYNEIYKLSQYTYNGAIQLYNSKFNKISFNNIHHQHRGIDLYDSSNENTVIRNYLKIRKNYVGQNFSVVIDESHNNKIYHNDFFGGKPRDYSGNAWDNDYPSGGNYWIDYTGEDNDGDGIGDIHVSISGGGGSKDRFPLMEPYGNLRANNNGPYFDFINNPIQFKGFACEGSPPYSWYWDLGDGSTSEEQNPKNTYTEEGKYTISLSVTDYDGNSSSHISYAWIQESNDPPEKPEIDGPTKGKAEVSYEYTFTAEDPEGAIIWYYIDWDDSTTTGWIGPYSSGTVVTKSHKWLEHGTYTIECKALDPYGAESPWGELTVRMPRNKATCHSLFLGFLEQFPLLKQLRLAL